MYNKQNYTNMVNETNLNFSDVTYETPEVTVVEVEVEQGFNMSGVGGTGDGYEVDTTGFFDEYNY